MREYYEQSSKLNNSDVFNSLGLLYYVNKGDKPNYNGAMYYFERSARLNNSSGLFNLGLLYEKGLGTPKDQLKAKNYFDRLFHHPIFR